MRTLSLIIILAAAQLSIFAQAEKSMLKTAFQNQNESLLKQFFVQWEGDTLASPTTPAQIKNDIHEIFGMFYDPENISKISGLSNWDSIYNNVKYFILQNSILVHVVKTDSLQRSGLYADSLQESFEIKNFRPILNFKNHKILYLSEKYESALYEFLGKPGKSSTWRNSPKIKFIAPFVKIIPATDNSWFFETRPIVNDIFFNRTKKMARVDFRLFFQEGSAYFVKENNQWKMIWSGISEY